MVKESWCRKAARDVVSYILVYCQSPALIMRFGACMVKIESEAVVQAIWLDLTLESVAKGVVGTAPMECFFDCPVYPLNLEAFFTMILT